MLYHAETGKHYMQRVNTFLSLSATWVIVQFN